MNALAVNVVVTAEMLKVMLADGREVAAPLAWFPRLLAATDEQRMDWRFKEKKRRWKCLVKFSVIMSRPSPWGFFFFGAAIHKRWTCGLAWTSPL